jgi:hypothetical protein
VQFPISINWRQHLRFCRRRRSTTARDVLNSPQRELWVRIQVRQHFLHDTPRPGNERAQHVGGRHPRREEKRQSHLVVLGHWLLCFPERRMVTQDEAVEEGVGDGDHTAQYNNRLTTGAIVLAGDHAKVYGAKTAPTYTTTRCWAACTRNASSAFINNSSSLAHVQHEKPRSAVVRVEESKPCLDEPLRALQAQLKRQQQSREHTANTKRIRSQPRELRHSRAASAHGVQQADDCTCTAIECANHSVPNVHGEEEPRDATTDERKGEETRHHQENSVGNVEAATNAQETIKTDR